MEELETSPEFESGHHMDYDDMLEHVIGNEHELLYLDTLLHDEALVRREKEAVSQ